MNKQSNIPVAVAGATCGIQSWSAGDHFPAVSVVVEEYAVFPRYQDWRTNGVKRSPITLPDTPHQRGRYAFLRDQFYAQPLAARLLACTYDVLLDGTRASFAYKDSALAYTQEALEKRSALLEARGNTGLQLVGEYDNWLDTKHAAHNASLPTTGATRWAWIVDGDRVPYFVYVSDTGEAAPPSYVREFIDGIEQ